MVPKPLPRPRSETPRRLAASVGTALVMFLLTVPVRAISVAEIIQLVRAGVSDDVVVALVQTGRTVFELDAGQVTMLKGAGVSDRVLLALVDTNRPPSRDAPSPPVDDQQEWVPAPGAVVGGTTAAEEGGTGAGWTQSGTIPAIFIVPVPVVTPFTVSSVGRVRLHTERQPYFAGDRRFGGFLNDGYIDHTNSATGITGFGRFISDGTAIPPAPRRQPR
jgi:hypothetical protein